jgi:phosphate/phosphite/phosphonate ABC transporter binding protein
MNTLIGKSLGRYHVVEQLGSGGMATVFKAYDTRLERDVALKIIRREAFSPEILERVYLRFEREAKSLAKLTHPNIVDVYDYGEYKGSPYLVMEYLPSGTLKERTGGQMPYQEAARILLPIARALHFAHEESIIHRDIKPSNILINRSGEPMLADFGIAKILEAEAGSTLTGTGVGVGTPEYMAPEQWVGETVKHTDIYALGVVYFELVTGCKPYVADTPAAVLLKQANEPLPRPRNFVPDIPEAVERMLFKALAKLPQDRYTDMGAFARVLERFAQGATTSSDDISERLEETRFVDTPLEEIETVVDLDDEHEGIVDSQQVITTVVDDIGAGQDIVDPALPVTEVSGGDRHLETMDVVSPQAQRRPIEPSRQEVSPRPHKGIPIWVWLLVGVGLIVSGAILVGVLLGGGEPEVERVIETVVVEATMQVEVEELSEAAAEVTAEGEVEPSAEEEIEAPAEEEAAPVEEVEEGPAEELPGNLGTADNPIILAIELHFEEDQVLEVFNNLSDLIFEHTGLVVEPFLFTSEADLVAAICSDPPRVHVASMNAFAFVAANERGCAEVEMVAIRFDRPTFSGQILVHADSGIESIPDLDGMVFCRTNSMSMGSWRIPRLYMMRDGIDPDDDLPEIVDTGGHIATIEGVYFGDCDAGATFVDARTNIEEEFPDVMEVVKVITVTDDIPNDGIQYHPAVSHELREKLNEIFSSLSLSEVGVEILEIVFYCTDLVNVDDAIYNAFRGIIEEVGISPQDLLLGE